MGSSHVEPRYVQWTLVQTCCVLLMEEFHLSAKSII